MSEDDRNEAATDENTTGKVGDIRKTRGIRFPESEWKEVKRAALAHDKPDAEERRIGPGSGFDDTADRADVPLYRKRCLSPTSKSGLTDEIIGRSG